MRRFKLIKTFPNSPNLGTIINQQKDQNYLYSENNIKTFGKENLYYILIYEVLKYPENWEEIIERDYEILSFIDIDNSYPNGKGKIYSDLRDIDMYLGYLKQDKVAIYSIKRPSDQEIFTVGDKIISSLAPNTIRTIVSFIDSKTNEFNIQHDTGFSRLSTVSHIKKVPLFKTEDGVDVFEGDHFYMVQSNFKLVTIGQITQVFIATKFISLIPSYKYFLTQKAAEEFILLNKPLWSISEIAKIKEDLGYFSFKLIDKLEELAREKLK